MSENGFRIDTRALARSFERASSGYDSVALLQREVCNELLERLRYFKLQPGLIVDLGAGTGSATASLCGRYTKAQVLAIDLVPGMLRVARRRQLPWRRFARICADARALPLATGKVDLVFCNLMLQWCDQPLSVFQEMQRVLRPGGLLLYSSFGPETLRELRSAWAQADSHSHVSQFPDMPQLGDAMVHAGLTEPVMDLERRVVHYRDVQALVRELRALGARNASADRHRGLSGRRCWHAMTNSYESLRVAAGVPATYEIIYGAAFSGESRLAGVPGETLISIDSLRRDR